MSINKTPTKIDLTEIRQKLSSDSGRRYWKSLEELAETNEFQDYLKHEFAAGADTFTDPVGRRRFIQLMGASLALAGFTSCTRQPEEKLVPYVKAPETIIPGKPLYFASSFVSNGYGQGVLVESHDGRPTKLEGNPRHPASLGATSLFAQASVLDLYDPDRIKVVTSGGLVRTWETLEATLKTEAERFRALQGRGLHILTGTVTSPTLGSQLETLTANLPEAEWHQWEAVVNDGARAGSEIAFGAPASVQYHFDKADVVVALDADFLFSGPAAVRHTKDFSSKRRAEDNSGKINRLYAAESTLSVTGGMADHRLRLRASEVALAARSLAAALGLPVPAGLTDPDAVAWMSAAAEDLKNHRGSSLVIAGDEQPAAVHALAHMINEELGNIGQTVTVTDPVETRPVNQVASLGALAEALEGGQVETLLILGGNPVYDAPADLDLAAKLAKAKLVIYLTPEENETSAHCHWIVPESHSLEAWGDVRAFDGTVTVIQPLIEPLFASKSAIEVVGVLLGQNSNGYEIVRQHWTTQSGEASFEKWWRKVLHDGLIEGSGLSAKSVSVNRQSVVSAIESLSSSSGLELVFRPDPSVLDGRHANNGWLQELPKPLTKLTWDNAALVAPALAESKGLSNGDVVTLSVNGLKVDAPVWILPGLPADTVTIHLGYGRTKVGRVGKDAGFNAYQLRTSATPWFAAGLQIEATGETYSLACTQDHSSMEGRDLIRTGNAEEYAAHPHMFHERGHQPTSESDLYPGFEYKDNAWGMAVDLNACVGCNACVVACQSENNIAVVGKDQVLNGREMHWMRIDRYFEGSLDSPDTLHQPVMCQHCENAPCESVCPVAATVHSSEGLNDMVYNRCVGTRYCSNNCPYKVRRFNFLLYSDWQTESLKLQRNPDVTVRSRGVMEKCSYCVQRINAARIEAELEDRPIEDGDIQTACQQVCPADAIAFGNINDADSRVAKMKKNQRNYGILTEINTKPRTSYLAKLQNPNTHIKEEGAS